MGLDVITLRNCAIKEEISDKELLKLVKQTNQAKHLLKTLLSKGLSEDEALAIPITRVINTTEGSQEVKTPLKEMLSDSQKLDALGVKCKDCPVSNGIPYGCVGYLSYPISNRCEKWVVSLVQDAIQKGAPYSFIVDFIEDQNITGNRISEMRNQNNVFFNFPSPLKIITKKSFFKPKSINLNQVWEMILFNGEMQTTHLNYLLMMLGGVSLQSFKPNDRYSKYIDDKEKYMLLDLDLPNNYDKSINELYSFCHHLFRALSNGHNVHME